MARTPYGPYVIAGTEAGESAEGVDDDGDARERMSGPPIGGERNYERDATGGIATRGEFEPPVEEKPLPPSEGLASRRRCGY